MLIHPISVLCLLMYLNSGHVTLLQVEFQPPNFFSNRTYIGLCPKFLVLSLLHQCTAFAILDACEIDGMCVESVTC